MDNHDWKGLRKAYIACRNKANRGVARSLTVRRVDKHIAKARRMENGWSKLIQYVNKRYPGCYSAGMQESKITKKQLNRIILDELYNVLSEGDVSREKRMRDMEQGMPQSTPAPDPTQAANPAQLLDQAKSLIRKLTQSTQASTQGRNMNYSPSRATKQALEELDTLLGELSEYIGGSGEAKGDDWFDDEYETMADRKFADRPQDEEDTFSADKESFIARESMRSVLAEDRCGPKPPWNNAWRKAKKGQPGFEEKMAFRKWYNCKKQSKAGQQCTPGAGAKKAPAAAKKAPGGFWDALEAIENHLRTNNGKVAGSANQEFAFLESLEKIINMFQGQDEAVRGPMNLLRKALKY